MWNKMIEIFPMFAEEGKDLYLHDSDLDWLSDLKYTALAELDIPYPYNDNCYLCDEYRINQCIGCLLNNPNCFKRESLFYKLMYLLITEKEAILVLMKQIANAEIPINED
jgi:hypothetical protein